jgi:predicted nucleotidyltransferase component of viral defense system
MMKQQITQIVDANPEYASISPVIEKEVLHHDILSVMIDQGVMTRLTFIGGTSLRMCFNSSRLSEDLDFNAGHDFHPREFSGLEHAIQAFIERKYETDVKVHPPHAVSEGDTVSWTVSIERESFRPDISRQKIHIDVCAVPSFDVVRRPLLNHYDIPVPTEGLLIVTQSLEEALVDKLIAFAFRARRIKPRDLWDLVWIRQRGTRLNDRLLRQKLAARQHTFDVFSEAASVQLDRLLTVHRVSDDFYSEMTRFVTPSIRERTLNEPGYWEYLQAEVRETLLECFKRPTAFPM